MSELPVLEMLNKQEEKSVFILLDGAVFPAMQCVYDYEVSPQVSPIYYGTRHEASLDVSPCLYKPGAKSKVWYCESYWRKNGVVFVSAYSYFEVLEYLKSLISIRLPNDQLAYWRFYSPEWFSMLMNTFSSDELSNFSGPISQWAVYSGGGWEIYNHDGHGLFEKDKEEGWFQLSQDCMEKMKYVKKEEFYTRVEAQLGNHISQDGFEKICRMDVKDIVGKAERLGFKTNSELEWFVITHYKYPELMERDAVKKLVENVELAALERQFKVEEVMWGVKGKGDQ
ncbi:DUF4123 domain-containing protein [Vreelandella olivaria]|uniref:DUF4123 domain-containing protein n=1 Tax=Vreelandella olivaria TaxID=390919 RepID=UPI00201F16DF|nr:DUF4123 domain-containing protein [Halomonas olivaria]